MTFEDNIIFSDIIREKISGLQLGILEIQHFNTASNSGMIEGAYHDLFSYIENKFAENPPSSDPVVSAVRRMYRRIGWEPTRYRPSSEAMIRRILKRRGLYHINNAVDLGNVVSARFHLPMGLYDMNKIIDYITVDVGKEGEAYKGLSIEQIHATGKMILRDKTGIFGNPTADSERTCIDPDTSNIMAIFFAPPEIDKNYLQETLIFLNNLYHLESPAVKTHTYIVHC